MATGFDLRGFLADPSYESFSSCRKDDLVQIAAHFNLGHSRQILKRDLQGLVLAEFLERELVVLPVPAGPAERKGARGEKDSRESVQGVLAGEPPKTPVTMPSFTDRNEKDAVADTRNDSAAGPGGPDAPVGDRPSLPMGRARLTAQVGGSFRPRNQPESDGAVEAYKSLMRPVSGADTCRESRRVVAFV
ncbi:unnamed protein product [Boreogadus saida]